MKAKRTRKPGGVTLELNRRDDPLMEAATQSAIHSPFKLNKILVPIDFSDCSKQALRYALAWAKEYKSTLALLYVIPPYDQIGEYTQVEWSPLQIKLKQDAQKNLSKLAKTETPSGVSIETWIETGSASSQIVHAAQRLNCDLIVISTHGRTGLKHVLLGSVTEAVVRHAPCPVFVVREREHEILIR